MTKLSVFKHGNVAILSDEDIEKAFTKLDGRYGTRDHRKLLEQLCLSRACGSHSGWTLMEIAKECKLITPKTNKLTRMGREFLQWSFIDVDNKG